MRTIRGAGHDLDQVSERSEDRIGRARDAQENQVCQLPAREHRPPGAERRRLGSKNGNERQRERAMARVADLLPTIRELQGAGTTSLRALASALNERGVPALRGGRWHASSVRNALALAGEQS